MCLFMSFLITFSFILSNNQYEPALIKRNNPAVWEFGCRLSCLAQPAGELHETALEQLEGVFFSLLIVLS